MLKTVIAVGPRKISKINKRRCEDPLLVVTCIFAFCDVTFEPIKIQTCSAPQNDCLNLSFVKVTHVVGKKMARSVRKWAIGAGGWGRLP